MRKFLSALLAVWLACCTPELAPAASLTPPNLNAVTSVNNGDLLLVWPVGSAGPLSQIQWSQVVTQLQTSLGGTYLKTTNNLSDVASPATAWSNLGGGTAGKQNTGTAGANIPFLNGTNTWSGAQTYSAEIFSAASASSGAGFNCPPGAAPTSPSNGDLWCTSAGVFSRINGTTQQLVVSTDSRFGGPTQNSQSTAYGFVLSDAGAEVYHPSSDTTARTWTIPANASVAFAVVTKIEIVNDCSAGVLTIAITSDTLVLSPTGSTGSRTLAACGMATLTKVGSTRWLITGSGIS